MMSPIQNIKKETMIIICAVQKVLIKILLVFTYYIGFGITYLIVTLFKHKLLSESNKNQDSFWKDAEEYNQSMDECLRQS